MKIGYFLSMKYSHIFLLFIGVFSYAKQSPMIEEQLKQAIFQNNVQNIHFLLDEYLKQSQSDPVLIQYADAKLDFLNKKYSSAIKRYSQIIKNNPQLSSIKMELATALFIDRQDKRALNLFNELYDNPTLPKQAYTRINHYLNILNKRNAWRIDGNISYTQTNNVANISDSPEIEDTGFFKSKSMLPQKAKGFRYFFNVGKDFNLFNSHYVTLNNITDGKVYWNNHPFDETTNHFELGYAYKKDNYSIQVYPFYEKRWFAHKKYHWSNGLGLSYTYWLTDNWQNLTDIEYEKKHFFQENNNSLTGNIATFSNSFIWFKNSQQLFYFGGTFSRERTREKQYGSNILNGRFGWVQEYSYNIASKLNFSFTLRKFREDAVLGGILPLEKRRKDHIYSINLQLWKKDWQILEITPKINLYWKKQISNLNSLYSYQDKSITILFERTF